MHTRWDTLAVEYQEWEKSIRKSVVNLQNTHGHGQSHTNLFTAVHAEAHEDTPGQQGQRQITARRVSTDDNAVDDGHIGRPALAWQLRLPVLGWRVARDKQKEGAQGHQNVHRDDNAPDDAFRPAVRQTQQRNGKGRLAADGRENREEARKKAENAVMLQICRIKINKVMAKAKGDIAAGSRGTDSQEEPGGNQEVIVEPEAAVPEDFTVDAKAEEEACKTL